MADEITAAFLAAPRSQFLPENIRSHAGDDMPLPLGHGQTNSQPSTVADMLRLLDIAPGMKVLDVGAGSGWTTALLAELVGPTGRVIGVERVPELTRGAQAALAAGHWPQAEVRQATARQLGIPGEAPFDRILVSAEAQRLPRSLVDQLVEGGVMVIPVAGVMLRVVRRAGEPHVTKHGLYVFVPLVEDR